MTEESVRVVIKPETFWQTAKVRYDTHFTASKTVLKGYPYGGDWKVRTYVVAISSVLAALLSVIVVLMVLTNAADRQKCHAIERVQHLDTEYHFLGGCVVQYDTNDKSTFDVNLNQDSEDK